MESCGYDRGSQPERADLESRRDSNISTKSKSSVSFKKVTKKVDEAQRKRREQLARCESCVYATFAGAGFWFCPLPYCQKVGNPMGFQSDRFKSFRIESVGRPTGRLEIPSGDFNFVCPMGQTATAQIEDLSRDAIEPRIERKEEPEDVGDGTAGEPTTS